MTAFAEPAMMEEFVLLRRLVSVVYRWMRNGSESLQALLSDRLPAPELFPSAGPRSYKPLERVVLTEEVRQSLFADYAQHRRSARGDEEIGWVLLGIREENEVLVLATLPAGADRQAGVAHVWFNSKAQSVGSKIVRNWNRRVASRLAMVGVVHTHPGSLRHPSDGDYQGDILWVDQLRGGEGVFGIGTAEGKNAPEPDEHRQNQGELGFSWYTLGTGDARYRRLPVSVEPGPDLARALQPVWAVIEAHAEALDFLCGHLARVSFDVVNGAGEPGLWLNLPVRDDVQIRVHLTVGQVAYFVERQGELTAVDLRETEIEAAVYLILAELAREKQRQRPRGLARAGR